MLVTVGCLAISSIYIFSICSSSSTLVENINLHSLASVALSNNSKDKNIFKPKSKLFSLESHLNYKLALERQFRIREFENQLKLQQIF